eukprot:TRINITY_DN34836_c0_g1_i1.p1 TRINITY_DN34836_c0_g1~~TRINITY_DN34836_c0_g1_i1.p1  ORF type:complete len:223 (-),score=79.04 TRINITY_DN34836_c0_g1_i1:40-708(-)
MPLGISLFGKADTKEARTENARELAREWQRRLRGEVRTVERSMRQIERDEEKIKRDIKTMAKQGGDPKAIKTLATSLVRSSKAKTRLLSARATMMAAANEVQNIAATSRLADTMSKSTDVMQQMNALVRVPELHESMETMRLEMMRAGLIEEMVDEGLEDIDGPELEEEALAEVDRVLDELAIDASVRMAIAAPAGGGTAVATAGAAPAVAAAHQPAAVAAP